MGAGHSLPGLRSLGLIAMSGLLALACGEPEEIVDTGFRVTGTLPDDGEDDVVVSIQPEFRVNGEANSGSCNKNTLQFAAVNDDGTIAFEPGYEVDVQDDNKKIIFATDSALPRGWTYAITVATGGGQICEDESGNPLEPYGFEFYVP